MPHRIHILGPAGAGKTTLAAALAPKINAAHIDSDTYYWIPTDPPFQNVRPVEERTALLQAELDKHENWILSGGLMSWGESFIPLYTLAVYLYLPPEIRIPRLIARDIQRYGSKEAIAPGGRMHATHTEFIQWCATYETGGSRAQHDARLAILPCPLLRLETDMTTAAQIDAILAHLQT